MKINRILLTLAGIVAVTSAATAQSFFDDDIYYDASKDKSTPKTTNSSDIFHSINSHSSRIPFC